MGLCASGLFPRGFNYGIKKTLVPCAPVGLVKHYKNNNFKKDIFQKRSFRSTVYSYDDYDHVPSQEASSYLDSAELQSLSSGILKNTSCDHSI